VTARPRLPGPALRARLVTVLEEARERGFLGPPAVERHLDHALGFVEAVEAVGAGAPSAILDLGAGGGVPGLVLASIWTHARITLLDASQRRCDFLELASQTLGLEARAAVTCGRAETLGRRPDLRERFDLVVARSFGRPSVTAECGAPFVTVGGRLVVSEPPAGPTINQRWPDAALVELGLRRLAEPVTSGGAFVVLSKGAAISDRWPRREGIPAKRPRWT
jgi:16S rRNA (guanine527-N7)-methyltransferase